jgi:hypothetical protein
LFNADAVPLVRHDGDQETVVLEDREVLGSEYGTAR